MATHHVYRDAASIIIKAYRLWRVDDTGKGPIRFAVIFFVDGDWSEAEAGDVAQQVVCQDCRKSMSEMLLV